MELVLPNNYVALEQEEMMYLDGGFWNSVRTVGIALDVAFAVITLGKTLKSQAAIRSLMNNTVITGIIRREVQRHAGTTSAAIMGTISNVSLTFVGLSLGQIIARTLDRVDRNRGDGVIRF